MLFLLARLTWCDKGGESHHNVRARRQSIRHPMLSQNDVGNLSTRFFAPLPPSLCASVSIYNVSLLGFTPKMQ